MATNLPPLVRVSGRDSSAGELLSTHIESQRFAKIIEFKIQPQPGSDYAQVDPQLTTLKPTISNPVTAPESLVGYGGLSPQQRYRMLTWLDDPLAPAPEAIQQLYITHLETNLFEVDNRATDAITELHELLDGETWKQNLSAWRALLLGYWLQQDQGGLAREIAQYQMPEHLLGRALGQLALLGSELTTTLVGALITYWKPHALTLSNPMPPVDVLEMRLTSWKTVLDADPLQYALAELPEHERQPKPWRCVHRDLRISVPQPNVEPILRPLLNDALEGLVGPSQRLTSMTSFTAHPGANHPSANYPSANHPESRHSDPTSSSSRLEREEEGANSAEASGASLGSASDPGSGTHDNSTDDHAESPIAEKGKWSLVLEFGHSRSEYFDFAIFRARQRPGYSQIMDEDRTLIHRVVFTKKEMRHFWILWEYVQNWSNTQVYVNGKEIEKWKVWPYSQYLR